MMTESIAKLTEALCLAQSQYNYALKDTKNSFFKSTYADLTSIVEATRTALTNNGLAVIQGVEMNQGVFCLKTILSHKSGEYICSFLPLNPVKNDPQGMGSAITYARRYSYAAMTGAVTSDDDGEAAQGREEKTYENQRNDKKSDAKVIDVKAIKEPDVYTATREQGEIIKVIFQRLNVALDNKELRGNINAALMNKKMSEAESIIKSVAGIK